MKFPFLSKRASGPALPRKPAAREPTDLDYRSEEIRHMQATISHMDELAWCVNYDERFRNKFGAQALPEFGNDPSEIRFGVLAHLFQLERKAKRNDPKIYISHPEGITVEEALVRCVLEREMARRPDERKHLLSLTYEQRRSLVFERLGRSWPPD
jgi:hypothetical protein